MVFVLLPVEMSCFLNKADEVNGLWFRWPEYDLDQARAFAKVLVESGEPDWDELSAFYDGPTFYDTLPENWMITLNDNTDECPAYWFFGLWDEGNTNQRANMVTASEDPTLEYMTYYPDMFTQAWSQSIPPFDGYDPLFDLPPAPGGGGERQAQNYNEWKYAPFANIWNGIGDVLGEVKTIGPEMRSLGWWARYEDAATIEDTSSTIPAYLTVTPVIRVFTDAGESSCYLYYLNRQCREDGHEFLITCDEDDFPEGVLTEYALDHNRRFIIPVDEDGGVYSFLDTLDAGQGRLVQFVTGISSVADARVTAPDVWAEGSSGATREYRFTAGEDLDIYARVYNMLTTARRNVSVTLYDITDDSTQIGQTATIALPALSTGGYSAASDTAHFEWSLDGADIGAHVLELRVAKWTGEPDTTDNVVRVAFLVEPRDYSAEVLDDPWDMREATVSPPAWKTTDIDTVYNWDASAWTDSIGGMYEGTIPSGHLDDNRLVLHIPASSLYWIDGDMYNRFSLVGKTTGTAADIMLGWVDSDNDVDSMEVGELAMTYGRTEVIDLAEYWEGLTIKRLWLGFRYPEQPVLDRRVRIGRVWLEEATEP